VKQKDMFLFDAGTSQKQKQELGINRKKEITVGKTPTKIKPF
jgi:hypothetical protein